MSNYRTRITDYSDEKSTFTVPTNQATPPTPAEMTTLYAAINTMTIGTVGDGILTSEVVNDAGSSAIPASPFAQREAKWIISYSSILSNSPYSRELPAPDLTLLASGTDTLDLADPTVAAFVAAFEAVASVFEGNVESAVTVTSIKHVGRKN